MNELRIYFVDLIAFVPAADGSVWVLLPEARTESVASDGVTRIDSHFPVVLFNLADQGGSEWTMIHNRLRLLDPPVDAHAWLLDRHELRIAVSPAPVQTPGSASTGLPTVANWTDFTWVPDLASLGIPAKVDPDCLLPLKDPSGKTPSDKIAARLHLEAGELTTFQFVKRSRAPISQKIVVPRLELKPLTGGTSFSPLRACADVVMAKVPFTGPTVEVSAVDLETGDPVLGRSVHLRPTETIGSTPVVHMLVGNLSPELTAGAGATFGVHFERCYDLVPGATQRPIPHLDSLFPHDSVSYVSPSGVNADTPAFIRAALKLGFTGFNGPICSLAKLES